MVSIIKEEKDLLIDYDDECPICYESLKEKDIAILNCTHTFHYKCIGKWMNSIKKNNFEIKEKFCPTCMNGDEIVNIVCREKYIPKKKELNNKVNVLKKKNFNKIFIKKKDKCIIS